MKRQPIEIETAKRELIRINEILDKPHLLIGGLAVQRYVASRDSKDIDLVCDHKTSRYLLRQLYPTDSWEIEEVNDDEFRPSYIIRNRIEDYGDIFFGPKITEREPYKYLDWDYLIKNGKPITIANVTYKNIIIPSCSHLAFSKLISFLSRDQKLINKRRQDLEDLTDLSNQISFNIIQFTSISQRTKANEFINQFLSSLTQEENKIFDRSAIGALKRQFGFINVGTAKEPTKINNIRQSNVSAPIEVKLRINPYKLFYFRTVNKKSIKQLSKDINIGIKKLENLEQLYNTKNMYKVDSFHFCTSEEIKSLENELKCFNCLEAGKIDDFGYLYMDFYLKHKKNKASYSNKLSISNKNTFHKAIVFDFDGTITVRTEDLTTWERIWVRLGYDINDCSKYFEEFMQEKITHKEWCDLTRDKFLDKGLTFNKFEKIADEITLIPGTKDLFKFLSERGIKIYIVSGSIKQIISRVLGELNGYIEEIKANNFEFGNDGKLKQIIGTDFDFEGKSEFLSQIMTKNNLQAQEVLFVGNSINDTYASHSGADTLCVNPRLTDPTNLLQWHNNIRKMDNLTQILKYIRYPK